MMKKVFLIAFVLIIKNINSQSIKNQVLNNVSKINSIDINYSDYSDLKVLGKAIGDAKIVFLGEQDHGDATTFEAKSRIIKYLHEKKGFNVLAFESDFFSINRKSDNNRSIEKIEESIFSIWSNCLQVNPLFKYIKAQEKINPIIISGFDCQIAQKYEDDEDKITYLSVIKEYIKKNVDVTNVQNYDSFEKTLKDLIFFEKKSENKNAHFKKIKKNRKKIFYTTLTKILNSISNKTSFLYKSLENALFYAKMAWEPNKGMQSRDIQMGKNILWLNEFKFPNEKIIIWGHNGHLARKTKNTYTERNNSAGDYVFNNLENDQIYSIGFSSRIGFTQRATLNSNSKKYKIPKPEKESFENWIHSKKFDYAFINFKDFKKTKERFFMKGIFHFNAKADWTNSFDGVFYIDEIQPCIKEKNN